MIDESAELDVFDLKLLRLLQQDASLSQRDIAERVGLSQNACWRRLQRLEKSGLILGRTAQIDVAALGLDLTVLVMIRTRHHASEWAAQFRAHVDALPEVTEFHRIGGDWDYMIKVAVRGIAGYDDFYQRLIKDVDLERVTGLFSMEAIIENRPVDLTRVPTGHGRRRR